MRDERDPADVFRVGGQLTGRFEQLGGTEPLQLTLGVAEPGDQ